MGGMLGGGALRGSLARTVSLTVLVSQSWPVVWEENGIPSYSMMRMSLALLVVSSGLSIMARVVLVLVSTLVVIAPAPS